MPQVVFTPSGLSGTIERGSTVLDAARRLGADLDTVCGGRGICGRCQIDLSVGTFAKWGVTVTDEALGPRRPIETDYRGNRPLIDGRRLGCAATILDDVVVDVPPDSQRHRQVVRKDLDLPPIEIDALFTLRYVEVPTSRLGDEATFADVVAASVAQQHGRPAPTVPARLLPALQPAISAGGGSVTVAIDDGDAIVAVWPGYVGAAYGVAVDVGSTTIAGHLCELSTGTVVATAGSMNPQIKYGEDLMSRVSYVMMNPGGERELTDAVRRALDELVGSLAIAAEVDRDHILELVIVGNPIMHHLVLGIDPTPLGQAPFTLATDQPVRATAGELGLTLPYARCYVGPCIAGHVGADTAGAILAEGPHRSAEMQLLVDVGTNAEIVLGDSDRQFAASSPTGPAFEGAQISCGQRATAGAIERVRIDPATLEPRLKVIGVEAWSDAQGFGDAAARTGVTGICGSGIIDVVAEMFLSGVIDRDGVIRGELADRTDRVVADGRTFSYVLWSGGDERLAITQNDVRAIQLAKAALRAGIDLLVEHAGHPPIGEIRLAGAFGAHIDPVRAMVLGLVPDCPVDRVVSVGNAAGTGAVQALLSASLRAEMERAVRDVVKIETATEPRFQELFVAAMAMPHASAETPHLAQVVALPASDPGSASTGRSRRRRGANA
ncbi:MAG: ASKHA domain-containing protein [Ilumatobacter sp.]|uniref:ASKHA domain-containing protein n=1 Tax=Ilumatobacter sp. TaxID=1967498 RepID=UPI0026029E86|nr:ASKHA domain-containing protein [Ilumatobacter sp.]MDJ0769105.1 ASKHA domain-containing protein [Ilumatobacter sp.]